MIIPTIGESEMSAIIFGASGQDGFYLSKLLQQLSAPSTGVSRSEGNWLQGDVSNLNFVENLIKTQKPKYVFHLAARSTTRHQAMFENHAAISTGTLNILEAVRLHSPHTKVFLSGSAMQFQNKGLPIDENSPFEASSPYSVSRIQSTYAGRYFREKFALKVYIGYFFNHDSSLRSEEHVNQKIASAAKRISKGSQEILELGDIEVKKEFNYAGDVVKAIWLLVNQETTFEAVIGSGKAHAIKDWVEACFKIAGKNWKDHIKQSSDFTPEYRTLVSSPQLIKSLGWEPKVNFNDFAKLMMESTI